MGERHGDRNPHVGQPELGQDRGVAVLHERVNDRLRVHDDVDPAQGGTSNSQRASITSSPLFIRRRRVDGDLGPHVPVGVIERLFDRRLWRCGRPARSRNGPPEQVRTSRATSSTLRWPASAWKMALCSLSTGMIVDAVRLGLAVHERAGHHHHFLVGQRDGRARRGSRPAWARARPRPPAPPPPGRPRGSRRRRDPRLPTRICGLFRQGLPSRARRASAPASSATETSLRPRIARPARPASRRCVRPPARPRRKRSGIRLDDGEGLLAHAAGAAEDGELLHCGPLPPIPAGRSVPPTWALVMPKRRSR